jgi:hypothetical protein
MKRTSFAVTFAALAAACAVTPGAPEESPGSTEERVQADARSTIGTFEYDTTTTGPILATGAVIVPHLDATHAQMKDDVTHTVPVRGTCGVTFISWHYAITAGHCVDNVDVFDPPNQTFTVQQYDISTMTSAKLAASESVGASDLFPHYSHTPMTAADGYKVTTYHSCHLVTRCLDTATQSYGACPNTSADIALIKCDDRPLGSPSIPVADSDPMTGPVQMNWFHEVLGGMPLKDPGTTTGVQADRFQHYTLRNAMEDTFHYMDTPSNQLMPLRSQPFGEPDLSFNLHQRTGLGPASAGPVVFTDLYGCHGTSGSGVLTTGTTPTLLGPVARGGDGFHPDGVHEQLCVDPLTYKPSQQVIAYTQLPITKAIAQPAFTDTGEQTPACTETTACDGINASPAQTIACKQPVDFFRRDSVGAVYSLETATNTYSGRKSSLSTMIPDVILACPPGQGVSSSCTTFSMYSSQQCPTSLTCNGVHRPTKACSSPAGWQCCGTVWGCGFCP